MCRKKELICSCATKSIKGGHLFHKHTYALPIFHSDLYDGSVKGQLQKLKNSSEELLKIIEQEKVALGEFIMKIDEKIKKVEETLALTKINSVRKLLKDYSEGADLKLKEILHNFNPITDKTVDDLKRNIFVDLKKENNLNIFNSKIDKIIT